MGMNEKDRIKHLLKEIGTSNSAMKLKAMTEHRASPGLSNEVMLICSNIDNCLDELNVELNVLLNSYDKNR